MLEIYGNLFEQNADVICITTNGFVRKDGRAVMGKGCAREAVSLVPGIEYILGNAIKRNGNVPNYLARNNGINLYSFPVKPISSIFHGDNAVTHMQDRFMPGQEIPGWACKADIDLIKASAEHLVMLANKYKWNKIVLPRPGCGAGELDWYSSIKPMLEKILDDRFHIITFAPRNHINVMINGRTRYLHTDLLPSDIEY